MMIVFGLVAFLCVSVVRASICVFVVKTAERPESTRGRGVDMVQNAG